MGCVTLRIGTWDPKRDGAYHPLRMPSAENMFHFRDIVAKQTRPPKHMTPFRKEYCTNWSILNQNICLWQFVRSFTIRCISTVAYLREVSRKEISRKSPLPLAFSSSEVSFCIGAVSLSFGTDEMHSSVNNMVSKSRPKLRASPGMRAPTDAANAIAWASRYYYYLLSFEKWQKCFGSHCVWLPQQHMTPNTPNGSAQVPKMKIVNVSYRVVYATLATSHILLKKCLNTAVKVS